MNSLHRSKSLYFPQKGFIVNNELALDWLILIFSILNFFRNILEFLEKYLKFSLYTKSINKVIKGETSCKMF